MEAITAKLADTMPSHLSHPGTKGDFPWQTYVSMIVMWSFFTIGQPTLFTKFFTMNSYRTMFRAVILGTTPMTTTPIHSGKPVKVLRITPAPTVCAPIIASRNITIMTA